MGAASAHGDVRLHNLLIKVREKEYKPLLDREKTLEDLKQLRPWILLIRDITDYGTNLIPRCIGSSDRKLEDAVLVAALLRQVVAMLDGVEVLLSSGAVYASNLQMRALFEASICVDWMLAGDLEKKAQYYYVHNLRRIRMWARRAHLVRPNGRNSDPRLRILASRLKTTSGSPPKVRSRR
jgi:hypothetical protein